MAKRKGQFDGNVQILSDLPLEVCFERLVSLNHEQVEMTLQRKSSDVVEFHATLSERGIVRAIGKGSLRRWEGTLTRVDCDVKVNEGILRWLLLFGGFFLLTMIALPIMILLIASVNPIIWISISLIFLVIMIGLMGVVNFYTPIDDTPQNLLTIITSALE